MPFRSEEIKQLTTKALESARGTGKPFAQAVYDGINEHRTTPESSDNLAEKHDKVKEWTGLEDGELATLHRRYDQGCTSQIDYAISTAQAIPVAS